MGWLRGSSVRAAAVIGLIVAALSVTGVTLPHTVQPTETTDVAAGDDDLVLAEEAALVTPDQPGGHTTASQGSGAGPAKQAAAGGGRTSTGAVASRGNLACAGGQNGGPTDVGVSANRINLASTVVLSGIGASFLADSPKAMQAVVNKVNRAGGICGRTLSLTVRDDRWDPSLGQQFLVNFMQSKQYFAFPVVPSSEGLTATIKAGELTKAGMPVVGSDGMLIEQYRDPWVWPVATATVSTMRVMARHGYDQGARRFGIVFDNQYKFGKEGADAFRDYVQSLPGAQLKAFVGIRPGESSYGSEVQKFNDDCNDECDMVALLLEPSTAETWIAGRPARGRILTSGAQTLFNRRFAQNCKGACHDMLVWTGYNPPIDALAGLPDVAEYVTDVRAIDPGIDVTNAFVQGAYLGMTSFVEALQKVGPELTRQRLRDILNATTVTTDLASTLSWSPTKRHANSRAQAFSLQYAGDDFSGFRNEQTGWIADPLLGN